MAQGDRLYVFNAAFFGEEAEGIDDTTGAVYTDVYTEDELVEIAVRRTGQDDVEEVRSQIRKLVQLGFFRRVERVEE